MIVVLVVGIGRLGCWKVWKVELLVLVVGIGRLVVGCCGWYGIWKMALEGWLLFWKAGCWLFFWLLVLEDWKGVVCFGRLVDCWAF